MRRLVTTVAITVSMALLAGPAAASDLGSMSPDTNFDEEAAYLADESASAEAEVVDSALPETNGDVGILARCDVTLKSLAEYKKPALSVINRESGHATLTATCDLVAMTVKSVLTHQCFGREFSDSDSQSGSGMGPLTATTYQEVPVFGPVFWCAYGTQLAWYHEAVFTYPSTYGGATRRICIRQVSSYGVGSVRQVSC